MPGGDRTGPRGGGPKTGRGLGYCSDNDQPGYAAGQPGLGLGRGFRWGGSGRGNRLNADFWPRRGWGSFIAMPIADDPEMADLKTETKELRSALQQILERLDKLDR